MYKLISNNNIYLFQSLVTNIKWFIVRKYQFSEGRAVQKPGKSGCATHCLTAESQTSAPSLLGHAPSVAQGKVFIFSIDLLIFISLGHFTNA